jgi:hypothetical protein
MDVVGHDHKRVKVDLRPNAARPTPFLAHDFAECVQVRPTRGDLAEERLSIGCADC